MRVLVVGSLAALLATTAFAQQQKPVQSVPAAPAHVTPAAAAAPAVPVKPVVPTLEPLSELEKAELTICDLQGQLIQAHDQTAKVALQAEQQQAAAETQAAIAKIEAAHPGYKWHFPSTPHDSAGLVPIDKPKADAKVAEPKK